MLFRLGEILIVVVALLFVSVPFVAQAQGSCSVLGAENQLPSAGWQLCNEDYAAGYSLLDREPLWVAEHLTASGARRARSLSGRPGGFYADARLPAAARSKEEDYRHSSWVRGHMAPSGDMSTWQAREESFALSNVVPQNKVLNSGAWERIENRLRTLATTRGEIYVVTGPAFRERRGAIGKSGVRIPSSVWKAVYVPAQRGTTVVVCRNDARAQCGQTTVATLERVTGIDPFPGLPLDVKNRFSPVAGLPAPHGGASRAASYEGERKKKISFWEKLFR